MKTFCDNAGRTWTVQVNVDAIKRVRDLAQVNLLEVVDGKLLERLVSDPVLLCDVIYALCKPEAETKNVSDVDFGRAMAGDAIDAATTALLEELVGFFPQGRRAVLAKALTKLRALETAALKAVDARLDSPELERRMEAELQRLGTWSGDAPASSASIPGDSH
jgi:Ran GTPase-activating protein (RanGAP) involved in mRNA processing and transport